MKKTGSFNLKVRTGGKRAILELEMPDEDVVPDNTLQSRIAKGSFLVRDGWSSTDAAIKALGFKSAPAVVHENAYRDVKTGFHTNDAESENSRVKGWNRVRYGQLRLNKGEMDEYVYYVNIGRSFSQVAKGLAISNGGVVKNKILK